MPCSLICTSLADAFQQMTYRSIVEPSTWFVLISSPTPNQYLLYDVPTITEDATIPPITADQVVFQGDRLRIVEFAASFTCATVALMRPQ